MNAQKYIGHESKLKKIYLYRFLHHPKGVFGHFVDEYPLGITVVERPWLWNEKDESCICAGEYICVLGTFKGYAAYQIIDPTGVRTDVYMHIGNDPMKDSTGCPLIGSSFGKAKKHYGVTSSKVGFDKFMKYMNGVERFKLVIVDLNHVERTRKFSWIDLVTIKRRPPKVDARYTPEMIIEKMEKDPGQPNIKYSWGDKFLIGFWYIKPFLAKGLKWAGPVVFKVNPLIGAAMMAAGEGADRMKSGLTERQKQGFIEQIVNWVIAIIEAIKKRGRK